MNQLEKILEELKSDDISVRIEAATSLASLNDANATSSVRTIFQEENDWRIIANIFQALGQNKSSWAVEILTEQLRSEDFSMCEHAAYALLASKGIFQIERQGMHNLEPLFEVLENPSSAIRSSALLVLLDYAEPRVKIAHCNALKDKDEWVRRIAAYGLGKYPDPLAKEPLTEALNDPCEIVRKAASDALQELEVWLSEYGYDCRYQI